MPDKNKITGKIHSVQTLGTLDGPGIRYVLFMQGCPLRCACCHNPDTWEFTDKHQRTPEEVYEDVKKYESYFGTDGGITVSGGEPLMQAEFVAELFRLCKKGGINTCLDTSGCVMDSHVKNLLKYTDLVLLDIKYTNEGDYREYVGGSLQKTLDFLMLLENNEVNTWLRQVIIEGLNDNVENIKSLGAIASGHRCVTKVELLPFRKLCISKYNQLGVQFPLEKVAETPKSRVDELTGILENNIQNLKKP